MLYIFNNFFYFNFLKKTYNINATTQKRNFCYSRKGKRCVVKTHSQEVFKKYTGIFAISTKGVLGWKLYDKGGINSERLYDFYKKI